ncbi:MAG TPA: NUDIX domain-containing protein [Anaerolineae bacterium]|nr:NUDIX domain-containing protein [Anaerolineae bacterium]
MSTLMRLAIRLIVPRHRVGVNAVPIDKQGRVLLLNHVFHPHIPWGLPGGWLNAHESPATGALRELLEETGLHATLGPAIYTNHEGPHPHVAIAYYVTPHPGTITLSNEIIEARWFYPHELPTPLHTSTTKIIKAALAYHQKNKQSVEVIP